MARRAIPVSSPARRLSLARWAVLATLALVAILVVAGIPRMAREAATACTGQSCYGWQPTPQLAGHLVASGIPLHVYAVYYVAVESLFTLAVCLIGLVMVLRRPDEPMALFGAFTLVTFSSAFSYPAEALALSDTAGQFMDKQGWP